MWVVVFIGLAALTWLIELASGPGGMAAMGVSARWFDRTAMAFATLGLAQLLLVFLRQLIRRDGASGGSVRTDLLQALLSGIVFLGAFFSYVHWVLGVDITGLLATSAVLSVIVGFALQATLGNVFAGISIELEHRVRVGDFVRRGALGGEVIALSWRSVHVRSETGSILVVPNSAITSDVLEVVPREQGYRHEIEFAVSSARAPGLVIQAATRILRNGVPGIRDAASGEVILRDRQPDASTCRYAARFHITAINDRDAIGSAVLERIWYQLSRTGGEETMRAEPAWRTLLERALAGVSPDIHQQLLQSARVRRYGRGERYRDEGVGLIVEGSMNRARPVTEAAAPVQDLIASVTGPPALAARQRRLDYISYLQLRSLGPHYVGPLSDRLCECIASGTDDPWVAYQAFAAFVQDAQRRQDFLQHAPRDSQRTLPAGSWLGVDAGSAASAAPGLARQCSARENCTLLVWSAADFRQALNDAPAGAAPHLVSLLG
jgi:hypothetical protein